MQRFYTAFLVFLSAALQSKARRKLQKVVKWMKFRAGASPVRRRQTPQKTDFLVSVSHHGGRGVRPLVVALGSGHRLQTVAKQGQDRR
jgi:hypothetical protein